MPLPDTTPGTLDALTVSFGKLVLEHDPLSATLLGLHDRNHELTDLSPEALDAAERAYSDLRDEVGRHRSADADDEVDRRALVAILDNLLFTLRVQRSVRRNPMRAPQLATAGVLFPLIFEHVPDREAAVAGRLAALPVYLEQARDLIEPTEVPPLWCEMALASGAGSATFLGEVVPQTFPSVTDAGAAAADAMRSYAGWLEQEVAPVASGSFALGEEGLRVLLRDVHLLPDGPEEVLARGRVLLEEGEAALREAAGRQDWGAAMAAARSRRPGYGELIAAYRKEVEALREFCLSQDLVTDPEAPAEVRETPEFLRPIMGYAAYLPTGPFDSERSGTLWITPPADPEGLADHSYSAIQPISGHEGYPGHHLQLTTVNRLPGLVRRMRCGSTLMSEGWGLYVEELLHEAGYYTPEARLVQLAMRQWRAARIVVDIGLHTGELSVAEAVDLLVDRAGITRGTAQTEVNRYTTTPTQPFTYLYGAEEIRRIRTAWMPQTGGSLRAFHDALLSYGHMPPALAAERMLAG